VLKRILSWFAGGPRVDYSKEGRNDDCPCGSGEKFKRCCIDEHHKKTRAERDGTLFGSPKG